MSTQRSITYNSNASKWDSLAASIQDALFDAQHCHYGLQGRTLNLTVIISRKLLPLDSTSQIKALQKLSAQLQRQGVIHSFHCAASGYQEPGAHQVRISSSDRGC
jgi:hypothetical protein